MRGRFFVYALVDPEDRRIRYETAENALGRVEAVNGSLQRTD